MRMLCASRVKTCFLGPSRIKWLGKSSDMSMWNPIMTISQYLWQTSSCFCWGLCSWHHEVWGLFQRAWNGRCRLVNTWPVAMHSMMVMMATSLANWNCDDEMVRPPPKKHNQEPAVLMLVAHMGSHSGPKIVDVRVVLGPSVPPTSPQKIVSSLVYVFQSSVIIHGGLFDYRFMLYQKVCTDNNKKTKKLMIFPHKSPPAPGDSEAPLDFQYRSRPVEILAACMVHPGQS